MENGEKEAFTAAKIFIGIVYIALAVLFVALYISSKIEANAQIQMTASVPVTELNKYTTCLAECNKYK